MARQVRAPDEVWDGGLCSLPSLTEAKGSSGPGMVGFLGALGNHDEGYRCSLFPMDSVQPD